MSELDELFNQLEDAPTTIVEQPAAVPIAELPATPAQQVTVSIGQDAASGPLNMDEVVSRHWCLVDELLSTWRYDRRELQDAANLVRSQIDHIKAANREPSGTLYEMYVKALEVKANTNANAIKLMDSTSKLISATKSGGPVQNNVQVNNNAELTAILQKGGPGPDDV